MRGIVAFFRKVCLVGLLFGVCFGLGVGVTNWMTNNQGNTTTDGTQNAATIKDGERTNILLLGVDARPGETNARSDTMILASIDPKLKKAVLVSIPRDTKINVKSGVQDKICVANLVGGPELAVSKVEEIMGEKIDYYVQMDFNGFKDIVDTLGGVDINVEQRMYKPSEGIDLQPGQQRLNGHDALAFVRFRGYALGDIGRTTHQQAFIKALAKEALQPKTVVKLPSLITQANKYVKTNLGLGDMLKLASWAPGFSTDAIVSQTLPGRFYDERNSYGTLTQSYWIADRTVANHLLNDIFAGKTVAAILDGPAAGTDVQKSNYSSTSSTNQQSAATKQTGTKDNKVNWERSKLPSPGHGVES